MDKALFNKLNKYLLYLAVGLTPLLFLPFTQNVLGFPKRFLVLIVVVLSLVAWLIKQKAREEVRLRDISKGFYWIVGLMLASFTLSTVFSYWKGLSFWGMPYSVADSLLGILVLALLSFLIIHSFKKKEYLNLILLLVGAAALVSLLSVLQLYGASLGIGVSTLVGSFNATAIFAAVVLPLALALLFYTEKRAFLLTSSLILLLAIVLINFKAAWLVLILGVLVLLFCSTWNSLQIDMGWITVLIACLALAIFFFLLGSSLPIFPARPAEVSLNLSSEYDVVKGVFNQGIKSKILGSGPGTFVFSYSQHHSPLLNRTPFWGTRFRQGSSTFWDWFVTKGILGVLSLLALWGFVLWKGFTRMEGSDSEWGIKLGLLSSFVALIGASFLHSFNFSLWFLFWVVLGLLIGLLYSKVKRIKLNSKLLNIGYASLVVLIVLLGVSLIFLQGIRYYAAAQHKQGLRLSQQGKLEQAINRVSSAVQLSESSFSSPVDLYYRNLSQLYLSQAMQVTTDKQQINPGLVRTSIREGSRALNRATEIAPFNPANWNVRGFFYRNLIGIEQAGNLSLKAYQKAAELEPSSPFPYTEKARVNILMAQQGSKSKKKAYKDASKALSSALELKPDYAPAHYLRAVVYDQQGNLKEAIDNLEKAEATAGGDLGLTFQLGLLYWRNGDVEQAQTKFKQAVRVDSEYANALYMLGLTYDKQGEKEKAKQQFEKVAELNPDNEKINQILQNLKEGKSALQETGTTTTPLQEVPPEIQE